MVVLDGIDDAVVKLDGKARFVGMNLAAATIYQRIGLSFLKHLKGNSFWEVWPQLKGTFVEKELSRVIDDHVQVSFEFHNPRDQRWYETKGTPLLLESSWCFETSPKEKMLLTRKGTAPCRGLIRSVQVSSTQLMPNGRYLPAS
jgi:PAS domain-containing protein